MAGVSLFPDTLRVINIGAGLFEQELAKQNTPVIQMDWRPPAGGDPVLARALDTLLDNPLIDAANALAVERVKSARPVLVDIATAIDVVPGMTRQTICHAGPPHFLGNDGRADERRSYWRTTL